MTRGAGGGRGRGCPGNQRRGLRGPWASWARTKRLRTRTAFGPTCSTGEAAGETAGDAGREFGLGRFGPGNAGPAVGGAGHGEPREFGAWRAPGSRSSFDTHLRWGDAAGGLVSPLLMGVWLLAISPFQLGFSFPMACHLSLFSGAFSQVALCMFLHII